MFEFGAGTLWGFPVGGNTAANPTPMKFGTLQDVSLDISGDVKQLYGQKQFPEAVARGKCKITGKSKFAAINGKMLNEPYVVHKTEYIDSYRDNFPAAAPNMALRPRAAAMLEHLNEIESDLVLFEREDSLTDLKAVFADA